MKSIKSIILILLISFSINTTIDAQRKNVLLIVVDDLNTDQAAFGNTAVHTPNIDVLAQEGIQFTNTQCSWPVCGASRASFTTGTYPETNGVMDLKTKIRHVSPNIVTLPQYLKEIGYTSEAVGKIYDPRCIDDQYDYPTSWTSPYNKDYTYPVEYGPFVKGQYRVYVSPMIKGPATEKGPDGVLDDGYIDGQIALDAVNKLNSYKNSDKPFFLAVGFKKPHTPFIAPKKYWDMYDINDIEISPYQTLPVGTSELALNNTNNEIKGYDDVMALTSDGTLAGEFTSSITIEGLTFDKVLQEGKQKELIMGYYAAISYIDAQIGLVMQSLENNGLKDNTLVIFTSDHGFTLGDSGMWAKHNILNNTSNVPFIIVDPNRAASIETRAVQLIDIFPTVCDWLNIKELEQFQGNSMFANDSDNTTFPVNLAMTRFKKSGKIGYSFKRDNYRYTLWTSQSAKIDEYSTMVPVEEEFYKYDGNTSHEAERYNIINDTSEKAKLDEIKIEVEKWWNAYFNNHKNESVIPENPHLAENVIDINNRYKVYPNPANKEITVSGSFTKNTLIKIYSLDGKVLIKKEFTENMKDYTLDISALNRGVFVVSVNGINYTLIKE